jgi:hypothetical protein
LKERWDHNHKDHDISVGDLVLVLTVNFNNLEGNKKLKDSFVGPFVVKCFHGNNAVEVVLPPEFSQKHPTFPISLVKKFVTSPEGATEEVQPVTSLPLKVFKEVKNPSKIIDEKLTRVQGKDVRQYLVRFKNASTNEDTWLQEKDIPQANVLLRKF